MTDRLRSILSDIVTRAQLGDDLLERIKDTVVTAEKVRGLRGHSEAGAFCSSSMATKLLDKLDGDMDAAKRVLVLGK